MKLTICLLFCGALLAQSPQATISGVVRDSQGAVIVDAKVAATNLATGVKTTAASNETGFFSLRALAVGGYEIDVEQTGFRRFVRRGITLTTGQSLELNITLELGSVTETVTVSAAASLLETRTSEVGQLIESKTVEDMPLGDRRTMNLINITGAAVFVSYDSGQKPNFSLAGGRTQSQMFWIDGGSGQNMRLGIGQIDTDPPVESVQELKVLSNNYSAEYGGSAGGVIIATTKSGTNRIRGSLFEYLRNEKLDAPNFFAPIVDGRKSRAPLRYNVFGGTVGGPLRRDKTFYYFSYEGSRRRDGFTRTLTVPAELQKAGDFSETVNARGQLIPIYDPNTTRTADGRFVRDLFPGNRIAASRLDPVARNFLPFYPVANRVADTLAGANNFRSNYVNILTRNNFTVKLDHNIGSKDKLSGRFLYNSDHTSNTSVFPNPAAETLNNADRYQQFWYASWTRVVSASVVNELRFNYGDRINHAKSQGLGGGWPSKLGVKGVPDDAFPTMSAAGFTALGSGTHERRQFPIRQQQVVNNLSWIRGRHAFKIGGEARRSSNYEVNRPSISGNFGFSLLPTGQPGVAASGSGLATMLLGFPTGFSTRETQLLDRSSWYLAAFAQDDWSVRKDLTLNFGLRWETDTPITDANDRVNGFDTTAINPVSGTPGVVRFAGIGGWRTKPYDTDWNNFGPRFGFAWKPFGSASMVIRGGYGIFFAHPFDRGAPTTASLGFELSANLNTPDNGITAPFLLRDGVPGLSLQAPVLNDSFGAVAVGRNPNTAVTFYESDRRTGYSQQFNFGIQREFAGSMVVDVSYLGNLSRKLASPNLSMNQVPSGRLGPTTAQRDRPFPQFTNVSIGIPAMGVSSYHAGVVRFEKRFSGGLNVLSTYTWSKFLNNTDEGGASLGDEGNTYSNFYNRRPDWGPSENDIRHRFTWSSVYELPAGKGRRWLSAHPARHVLGDWSIGSLVTIQSGPPFTIGTQVNTTNAFAAGGLRADVAGDPARPAGAHRLEQWFNTGAFQQPAQFMFGNQGIGLLRSDGDVLFDFSVLRNFWIRESMRLQFRGEFFNALNHPNFGTPGRTLGAPGFGVVAGAGPGRRVQFGMRMTF